MPARFQNLILRALALIIRFHLPGSFDVEHAQRLVKELESSADLADL